MTRTNSHWMIIHDAERPNAGRIHLEAASELQKSSRAEKILSADDDVSLQLVNFVYHNHYKYFYRIWNLQCSLEKVVRLG